MVVKAGGSSISEVEMKVRPPPSGAAVLLGTQPALVCYLKGEQGPPWPLGPVDAEGCSSPF